MLEKRNIKKDKGITLSTLLFSEKPHHWPSSSYYCVRSALRVLSKSVPLDKPFDISELPSLIDQHFLYKGGDSKKNVWTRLTYRSRILRLAAEQVCRKPLRPWETRQFFEQLTLMSSSK